MRRQLVLTLGIIVVLGAAYLVHVRSLWEADVRYAEEYCRAEAIMFLGDNKAAPRNFFCRLENSDDMLRLAVVGVPGLYMDCLDPGLFTFELRECALRHE